MAHRDERMKKILVAVDSRRIREYCREMFAEDGFRVVLAGDGSEAVRIFCEESPDLVILDLRMPQRNGLEALTQIRAICPEIRVLLFPAEDEDCVQDQCGLLAIACVEKAGNLAHGPCPA